jgi:hypothetical protein
MTRHYKSVEVRHTEKWALEMCVVQRQRIARGEQPLSATALAEHFGKDARTIRRWIAFARKSRMLVTTRTGRVPKWTFNTPGAAE